MQGCRRSFSNVASSQLKSATSAEATTAQMNYLDIILSMEAQTTQAVQTYASVALTLLTATLVYTVETSKLRKAAQAQNTEAKCS
jgi:hypothetical protein